MSKLCPVFAVVGTERFLRAAALEEVLKTVADGADDLGPVRVSGECELAEVLDEVRTPSLLGGRRVVVVEDADDFITAHRQALEKYVADPSPAGYLILVCDSLPKNTKLHKLIAEHGEVRLCEPLKGPAFGAWAQRRAKDVYGKKIGDPALRRLRDLIGSEPGLFDTELSKLAAYVGARNEISVEDVNAATGESREEKVFEVINALAEGDLNGALESWQQVLATDRAAQGRSIAGLAFKVRDYATAHRELAAGTPPMVVSRRFFVDANTLKRRLDRMTEARLQAMQRALLDADLLIKTGGSTLEVAMERFLVEHGAVRTPKMTKIG